MTPSQQKIAVVGGVVAAAALLFVFWPKNANAKLPPPRKPGLQFDTRNVDALDTVIDALIADPKQRPETLTLLADQLSYYGLFAQELRLREKVNPALRVQLAPSSNAGGGAMSFRQVLAQK